MVTPAISGLFNPAALQAIKDFGIVNVVGDNSIAALRPANPYHCVHTSVAVNGVDGILIVPRIATAVNYDCSLPAENTDEYNNFYHSYWGRDLVRRALTAVHCCCSYLISY